MLWRASERSIRDSVPSAMAIVDEHGFGSVAFPVIGAGSGSFDTDRAYAIMMDTFDGIDSAARAVIVRYVTGPAEQRS